LIRPICSFAEVVYLERAEKLAHKTIIERFVAVAFVKPIGAYNEHMGYTDLLRGQQYVADLVKAVQGSAVWKDSVIIITYDEAGGRWDHVPPPRGDRWGPGGSRSGDHRLALCQTPLRR
jgi:phospholipase C